MAQQIRDRKKTEENFKTDPKTYDDQTLHLGFWRSWANRPAQLRDGGSDEETQVWQWVEVNIELQMLKLKWTFGAQNVKVKEVNIGL